MGACSGDAGGGDAGSGVVVEQTMVVLGVDDVIVEADRLIFPRATHADLLEREVGDFLVGDRARGDFITQKNPDGFLRRIVSIGATEDQIIIETELAYLSEIIAEGTFKQTIEPVDLGELPPVPLRFDPSAQISAVPGSPAAQSLVQDLPIRLTDPPRLYGLGVVNFSGLKFGPVTLKPKNPFKMTIKGVPTNIQPSATLLVTLSKGTFSFNPSTEIEMDIGLWDGLREFRFALLGTLVTDLSTNIEATLSLDAGVDFGKATAAEKEAINAAFEDWALNDAAFPNFTTTITSAMINLPTWALPTVPPVPVVSTLGFNLKLSCSIAKLKGTAKMSAGAKTEGHMALGALWQKDVGWSPVNERDWDVTEESQSLTGALSVTAGCTLKPRLELIFYGMAGP
ncbi:MAG TPA: hypothetical protein ENK31_03485, partial [Nannocystis exedens]|nr:hypothetical protein [Nannocystis exedens]